MPRRRIVLEEDVQVLAAPPEDDPQVRELVGILALDTDARRAVREELELTQPQVAEALGKALRTVQRWEQDAGIKSSDLVRLAQLVRGR